MNVGKVCKTTSIVLFILDCIVAIFYFDIFIFICAVAVGFVSCLLLYAIGEIIEQLVISNSSANELYELLKKTIPKDDNKKPKSYFASSAPSAQTNVDHGWICRNCNTKNDSNAQFCKDCGTYK